jgi:hypothetical protein
MRFFVQPDGRIDHIRRRDSDPRPQDDFGELAAAILGLLHGSMRVVGVAGHRHTRGRAQMEIPEHVGALAVSCG